MIRVKRGFIGEDDKYAVRIIWRVYRRRYFYRMSVKVGTNGRKPKELPFDHIYNPSVESNTVVLYADVLTDGFKTFHSALKKLAEDRTIRYILRYRPPTASSAKNPLFVSGYGVELMLKKTDYIVIDDREVDTGASHCSGNSP